METNGHDTISSVKRLLDTVSMVYIDVNVENACVISAKKSQGSTSIRRRGLEVLTEEAPRFRERCLWGGVSLCSEQNLVGITIYVAKPARLALFRVMKTTSPVNCNVTFVSAQSSSTLCAQRGH